MTRYILICLISCISITSYSQKAPFFDYCSYLSKEIQGKQHGFMAGNNTYYIGGFTPSWRHQEYETVGLTHPFFNDLRCRGTGMVSYTTTDGWDTGYGSDISGWEFYKDVRVAYGTILANGKEFETPVPARMYWQPDKMICEYEIEDFTIREEKFIAENDVVSTIITSSKPIRISFKGRSYLSETGGGTMYTSTAEGSFDSISNTISVKEGGTIQAQPVYGTFIDGATLMYNDMTNIIGTSRAMDSVKFWTTTEESKWTTMVENIVNYSFEVDCDSDGVVVSWLIDDDANKAKEAVKSVVDDAVTKMEEKTARMNSIFNDEVPYFRCSDDDIVKVYYFLNAINLMYYTFKDAGQLKYAHTQSAVNNYLGNHCFDNIFQSRVGSWYNDKEYYAYGNILIWRSLLKEYNGVKDYLNDERNFPDNLGTTWNSALNGGPSGIAHIPQAWQIFEHSGDTTFLREVYEYYSNLFPTRFYGMHWGFGYDAGPIMQKMANLLGKPEAEADKWIGPGYSNNAWVESPTGFIENNWEKEIPSMFGNKRTVEGKDFYGWSNMAYANMEQFPRDYLIEMTNEWTMDSIKGFNHPDCNPSAGARQMEEQWDDFFTTAPDIAWYMYKPLFKHHLYEEGNYLTIKHLKQYNMEWGVPVAPESRGNTPYPLLWGDQYSNFNAGKIDLLIEGIGGLNYSFADSSFTFREHMPKEWDFMEWRVPVKHHSWSEPEWVIARSEKTVTGDVITKKVTIENNPMQVLNLTSWNEGKEFSSYLPDTMEMHPYDWVEETFNGVTNQTVFVEWGGSPDSTITSSKTPSNNLFKLFPNPASEYITISGVYTGDCEVIIFDVLGQEVYRNQDLFNGNLVIPSNFKAGTYNCQVKTMDAIQSITFVKY